MSFGWEGDKIRLVPLDREKHLDNAIKWFNDPQVTEWLETGDWPLTRGAEEDFFRAADRRDLWNKGYGGDAVKERNRYAFEILGLRLLIATVIADNTRSLAMLVSAGYEEVGRVPERYWKRGAYRDQVILAVHKPR
jgi:hypothetical protein